MAVVFYPACVIDNDDHLDVETKDRQMKKRYHVELTEDERAQLRTLCVRRDIRPSSRLKAEALLQVDAGKRDKPIAEALGVTWNTIQRYRTQFAQAGSLAAYIEAGHLPLTLTIEAKKARKPEPRRRHVQKLAWHAKPLKKSDSSLPPSKRLKAGNRGSYLAARIARDRPDVLERMKQGEFSSMRAAAWEAGIKSAWRDRPPSITTPGRCWPMCSDDARTPSLA